MRAILRTLCGCIREVEMERLMPAYHVAIRRASPIFWEREDFDTAGQSTYMQRSFQLQNHPYPDEIALYLEIPVAAH